MNINLVEIDANKTVGKNPVLVDVAPSYVYENGKRTGEVSGFMIFKECVNSLDYAQNLIVVKTMPGLGAAAGANIDALKMPTVVGTLSGDDTTLVIMRDNESAAEFCAEIRKMLE